MDYESLMHMDPDKYQQLLENDCDDAIDMMMDEDPKGISIIRGYFDASSGHMNIHCGGSEQDQLKRIIDTQRISGASDFINERNALMQIANLISYVAKEITNWMYSEKFDVFPSGSSYERLIITKDMREQTGSGITKDLVLRKSHGITLVLDRNKDGIAKHGFSIATAYPSLKEELSETVGKLKIEDIILDKKMIFDNPYDRLIMLAYDISGLHAIHSERGIRVSADTKNSHIDMFINNDGTIKFRERTLNNRINCSPIYIREKYPHTAERFSEILYDIKVLRDNGYDLPEYENQLTESIPKHHEQKWKHFYEQAQLNKATLQTEKEYLKHTHPQNYNLDDRQ